MQLTGITARGDSTGKSIFSSIHQVKHCSFVEWLYKSFYIISMTRQLISSCTMFKARPTPWNCNTRAEVKLWIHHKCVWPLTLTEIKASDIELHASSTPCPGGVRGAHSCTHYGWDPPQILCAWALKVISSVPYHTSFKLFPSSVNDWSPSHSF